MGKVGGRLRYDNDNDIFIILTVMYIIKLHSIISFKLLPSPEGLISQFKTSSIHNICFCEVWFCNSLFAFYIAHLRFFFLN